jgi:hypothetical protein
MFSIKCKKQHIQIEYAAFTLNQSGLFSCENQRSIRRNCD